MKKIKLLLAVTLVAIAALTAKAQIQGRELYFYQPLTAGASGPAIELDTVTNTGTSFVTSQRSGGSAINTTVLVYITKISGTVAGTLTLYGCNIPLGGSATYCSKSSATATNWTRIMQPDLQTATPTITATDASANYSWNLSGAPFTYYRVSWTGAGTMSASFKANLLSH